jgi:hypothetical protein
MVDRKDKKTKQADEAMEEWGKLQKKYKNSCLFQADDIPAKLRMLGCYMWNPILGRTIVESFTDAEVELLAVREHERFNGERLIQRQWLERPQGGASFSKTPSFTPWKDLEEEWREVDRELVRKIPALLQELGHAVYRSS